MSETLADKIRNAPIQRNNIVVTFGGDPTEANIRAAIAEVNGKDLGWSPEQVEIFFVPMPGVYYAEDPGPYRDPSNVHWVTLKKYPLCVTLGSGVRARLFIYARNEEEATKIWYATVRAAFHNWER